MSIFSGLKKIQFSLPDLEEIKEISNRSTLLCFNFHPPPHYIQLRGGGSPKSFLKKFFLTAPSLISQHSTVRSTSSFLARRVWVLCSAGGDSDSRYKVKRNMLLDEKKNLMLCRYRHERTLLDTLLMIEKKRKNCGKQGEQKNGLEILKKTISSLVLSS